MGGTLIAVVKKKFSIGKFQLVYEFINKVLLPISKKKTIASVITLFFIECFSKVKLNSLPTLIIEHIYKVVQEK